jgi:gamma-carbonic anhydrase
LLEINKIRPTLSTKDIFVAPTATVLGNVTIGDKSAVWYGSVIRGDQSEIIIGSKTSIGENSVIASGSDLYANSTANPTTIGDNVIIGGYLIRCIFRPV